LAGSACGVGSVFLVEGGRKAHEACCGHQKEYCPILSGSIYTRGAIQATVVDLVRDTTSLLFTHLHLKEAVIDCPLSFYIDDALNAFHDSQHRFALRVEVDVRGNYLRHGFRVLAIEAN